MGSICSSFFGENSILSNESIYHSSLNLEFMKS